MRAAIASLPLAALLGCSNFDDLTRCHGRACGVDLVAAWSFDEGAGLQVQDVSGNANDGVVDGATWAPGRFGGGLQFDGENDSVLVADAASLDPTGALTLEAWVRPSEETGTFRTIVVKEATADTTYGLYTSPLPYFVLGFPARIAEGGAAPPVDSWTHIAGTYDGERLVLYVGGTPIVETAASGPVEPSTGTLRIGGNALWGEFFPGTIDEVRVYSRALSAEEIQRDLETPIQAD